jgi:hypothetical protein
MRYPVLIIMLLTYMSISGQVRNFNDIPKDILRQLNNMGADSSPLLDSCESAYFNVIFKDNLNGFDFTNKRIGFLSAGSKRNKNEYFAEERKRFYDNSTTINGTLYIFNASQKNESGGYDAAIVNWSKFLVPIDKVVTKLKKQH